MVEAKLLPAAPADHPTTLGSFTASALPPPRVASLSQCARSAVVGRGVPHSGIQVLPRKRSCGLPAGYRLARQATARRSAGLRPELVPGVEVAIVLPTFGHTAVLELEEETHVNVQVLAVSVGAVALNADHPLVICKQVL